MSKFNLSDTLASIAEGIVQMRGAEAGRKLVNDGLKACKQQKLSWDDIRGDMDALLTKRGLEGGAKRVTLSTIKWCYVEGVELETTTKSVMVKRADKGLVSDLLTGKPKTVKDKGQGTKAKGPKAKTEAVVDHCGIGMAKAMTQQGFIKFLNVLVYDLNHLADQGIDFGLFLDDDKLDMVRNALAECGYMTQDGAEWKVAIIKESDDEVSE